MKHYIQLLSLLAFMMVNIDLDAQSQHAHKSPSEEERVRLIALLEDIKVKDQIYRSQISFETTDPKKIAEIEAVMDTIDIEDVFAYRATLDLSLSKEEKDSLWMLQHQLDLANHLTLLGIVAQYGWLTEKQVGKAHSTQMLLLLHPPKDWDIRAYLEHYAEILRPEVERGAMKPEFFASFYDNMKGKILREPQLYGTNQQWDPEAQKVLPPMITDLATSNAAREEIGLPALKEGEYRLFVSQ